jgi:hypothetical protein
MDIPVFTLTFLGAVALFATWLLYLLRVDRARSRAFLEQARVATLTSRHAARTARREPVTASARARATDR